MHEPRQPEHSSAPGHARDTIRSAASSPVAWITLALVTIASVASDLWSKDWAFRNVAPVAVSVERDRVLELLPGRLDLVIAEQIGTPEEPRLSDPRVIVPSVLEFKLVLNAGAVFGIGAGKRWFFIAFTAIAFAAILYAFSRWTRPKQYAVITAYGLILGGGLGNLYDRIVYACVRDFLHPLPGVKLPFGITWPSGSPDVWPYVSNVADALLLIGIGIVFIHVWRMDPGNKQDRETDASGEHGARNTSEEAHAVDEGSSSASERA